MIADYYSQEGLRKRFGSDDYLDTTEFDFFLNLASNIDELGHGGTPHAEFCLSVISSSSANRWMDGFGPITDMRDA